jgi:hypothetical protein
MPQPSVSVHARYSTEIRISHLQAHVGVVSATQPSSIIQHPHSLHKRARKRAPAWPWPWHHRREPSIPPPVPSLISNQHYRSESDPSISVSIHFPKSTRIVFKGTSRLFGCHSCIDQQSLLRLLSELRRDTIPSTPQTTLSEDSRIQLAK